MQKPSFFVAALFGAASFSVPPAPHLFAQAPVLRFSAAPAPQTGGAAASLPVAEATIQPADSATQTTRGLAFERVNVPEVPGRAAWRMTRTQGDWLAPQGAAFHFNFGQDVAIAERDVVLVRFWVKGLRAGINEDDAVRLTVRHSFGGRGLSSFYGYAIEPNGQWQEVNVPFAAINAAPAGTAKTIEILLGSNRASAEKPLEILVSQPEVLNYGKNISVDNLPYFRQTYAGREAGPERDAWLIPALQNIEAHRKGELRVRVVDERGRPIRNARVAVRMKAHKFRFGTSIGHGFMGWGHTPENRDIFRAKILEHFNEVVPDNAQKWMNAGTQRNVALEILHWAHDNGLRARSHALIWPNWRYVDAEIAKKYATQKSGGAWASNTPTPELRAELHRDIDERFRNAQRDAAYLIEDWDVVNEERDNREVTNFLATPEQPYHQILADWFKMAARNRAALGDDAKLFINENSVEATSLTDPSSGAGRYLDTIKKLRALGAPLEGFGLQAHIGVTTPMAALKRNHDEFNKLGLSMLITEFDTISPDKPAQADMLRDYMTLSFGTPNMEGFTMWGFWDGQHWRSDGPLFYRDWTPKPALKEWDRLIKQEWWTNAAGQTGANGEAWTRGFLGDYEITATLPNGTTMTVPHRHYEGGLGQGTLREIRMGARPQIVAPRADATAWENAPAQNFGTAPPLVARSLERQSAIPNTRTISYLEFPTPPIDEAKIGRVTLVVAGRLVPFSSDAEHQLEPNDRRAVRAHRVRGTWSEAALNWNNQPPRDEASDVQTLAPAPNFAPIRFDVTELAREARRAAKPTFSVALWAGSHHKAALEIASRENTNRALRPHIEVR